MSNSTFGLATEAIACTTICQSSGGDADFWNINHRAHHQALRHSRASTPEVGAGLPCNVWHDKVLSAEGRQRSAASVRLATEIGR